MSFFQSIDLIPDDPIFGLYAAYKADPRPDKINLAIGVYQDERGKVPLLDCVRQAETELIHQSKEYLPIGGHPEFMKQVAELLFGAGSSVMTMQTVGGTGALKIGGEFLASQGFKDVALPDQTWPNHGPIFKSCEFKIHTYPYYDSKKQSLDFSGMRSFIESLPKGSVVLLQVCCHNPTGIDLEKNQWEEMAKIIKDRRLFPFFDLAYQGLGIGLEEDVFPLRLFANQGLEMMVSCSFSKNFCLYGERVGALCVQVYERDIAKKIASHLRPIIRSSYSNPPTYGASLVAKILQTPKLRRLWEEELSSMRARIQQMRQGLMENLELPVLSKQRGLFILAGLSPERIRSLREDKALYLLDNGRLNLAGLNSGNLKRVADLLK